MRCITRSDSRADQITSRLSRILSALMVLCVTVQAAAQVKVWAWDSVCAANSSAMTQMVRIYPSTSPSVAARELAARPEGSRVLCLLGFVEILASHPLDACRAVDASGKATLTQYPGPWCNHGAIEARKQVERLFNDLRAAGVSTIDALVLDNETTFSAGRYMTSDGANLAAIQSDPRFPALSKRLGFRSLKKLTWGSPEYYRWNELMEADFDAAMQRAVAEPLLARWPKAAVSNYGSAPIARAHMTPDGGGLGIVRGGSGFGTHSSMSFYGEALTWIKGRSFAGTQLGDSAFDMFRMNMHRARAVRATGRLMMPWIAARSLGCNGEANEPGGDQGAYRSPIANTLYWEENVIQLVMHGSDTLLLFNPAAWRNDQNPTIWNRVEDQARLSTLIDDLNARLGVNPGDSRWFSLPGLQDRVMATGRRVSGGTLWRFSFAPDVASAVVKLQSGDVCEVIPDEGEVGAWFFESEWNPLAIKADRSDIAWVEANRGSAWPDLDGDGSLGNGDISLLLLDMGMQSDLDLDGDSRVTSLDVQVIQARRAEWGNAAVAGQGLRPGAVLISASGFPASRASSETRAPQVAMAKR